LTRVPGVQLFSLQVKGGTEELSSLADSVTVIDWSQQMDVEQGPFVDTAALAAGLDLVIAADTAVAHLAGALAAKVWVPLSTTADWRWMHERDDSPWYPTMRLFRQTTAGDWSDVFARMAGELPTLAASKSQTS